MFSVHEVRKMVYADSIARNAFECEPNVELEFLNGAGGWQPKCGKTALAPSDVYRLAQPKVRPFKDDETKALLGRTVIGRTTGAACLIIGVRDGQVKLGGDNAYISVASLMDYYTFEDGSACGVKE